VVVVVQELKPVPLTEVAVAVVLVDMFHQLQLAFFHLFHIQ
jgi:hypothetical protein